MGDDGSVTGVNLVDTGPRDGGGQVALALRAHHLVVTGDHHRGGNVQGGDPRLGVEPAQCPSGVQQGRTVAALELGQPPLVEDALGAAADDLGHDPPEQRLGSEVGGERQA